MSEGSVAMKKETYTSAGVQIERAESFVERIKKNARRAGHDKMWKGAGSYAAIQEVATDLGIAITTDGVGTKLLVAIVLNDHSTIGIDLVAMCANDLICVGATPTMFLDYYAVGHLEDQVSDAIIAGIIEGCDRASMVLAGGETAEMPGLYAADHYDLAGFAIGTVSKKQLLTGEKIKAGQKLIGVASSGIHSNGLSLARKVMPRDSWKLLLEPTAIYVKPAISALTKYSDKICAYANITGGGWRNLLRLNKSVGFHISNPLPIPEVFNIISQSVEEEEMYKTFNMGLGFAAIVEDGADIIISEFKEHGFNAQVIGETTDKAGTVSIASKTFTLKDKLN